MTDAIEPIPSDEARAILETAIRDRLGENWEEEENGWVLVTAHDYMARLTKGRTNLDFYVDLLGNVQVEEKALNAAQLQGRTLAWLLLGLSLVVAFLIARIAGFL